MSDQPKQLAERPATGMERVKSYMLSAEVKERFTDMMGPDALYYLNQVLIIVAQSPKLQECSPQSILIAAMRAASLKLSVDPAQGQAWIIPYNGAATYQTGYRGVYELAQRTNLYRFINVFEVFEGEWLEENRMTGIHVLKGTRTGDKVEGYCLYFQLTNGFEKTFYMTVQEIEDHAQHYSPGNYNNAKSAWNKDNGRERAKMMKKTVLKNGLLKWGRFNQNDRDTLETIENEQGWIDAGELPAEDEVTPLPAAPKRTLAEINRDLGIETIEPPAPKSEPQPVPVSSQPPAWTSAMLVELGTKYGKHPNQIKNALNLSNLTADSDTDRVRHWMQLYVEYRAEQSPQRAAELANEYQDEETQDEAA